MKQWWYHPKAKVRKFEDDEEKAMVEDLTGGIPVEAVGNNIMAFYEGIKNRTEVLNE